MPTAADGGQDSRAGQDCHLPEGTHTTPVCVRLFFCLFCLCVYTKNKWMTAFCLVDIKLATSHRTYFFFFLVFFLQAIISVYSINSTNPTTEGQQWSWAHNGA